MLELFTPDGAEPSAFIVAGALRCVATNPGGAARRSSSPSYFL
ncbi:MAG: hypothetical protein R3B48_01945 [Kofleriaceae bacterium]